jgi:hypothetical protein
VREDLATHGDPSTTELITDRGLGEAQLGSDLAQSPALRRTSRLHAQRPPRHRNESQPGRSDYSPFGEKVLISDGDVIGRNVVFRSVGA